MIDALTNELPSLVRKRCNRPTSRCGCAPIYHREEAKGQNKSCLACRVVYPIGSVVSHRVHLVGVAVGANLDVSVPGKVLDVLRIRARAVSGGSREPSRRCLRATPANFPVPPTAPSSKITSEDVHIGYRKSKGVQR